MGTSVTKAILWSQAGTMHMESDFGKGNGLKLSFPHRVRLRPTDRAGVQTRLARAVG